MGVYIKNLSLPTDEPIEVTIYPDGRAEWTRWELDRDGGDIEVTAEAEAVEIETPHGRLIEEREAYDKIAEQEGGYYIDMDGVGRGLDDTPTVIDAED